MGRPAGNRVSNILVGGRPLDENKTYTLATSDFLVTRSGDGYTMFKDATIIIPPDRAPVDFEVVRKAVSTGRAIAPKVEGRIKRLDTAQKSGSNCN